MKEFLLTLEIFNEDWSLKEKRNFILRVQKDERFEDGMFEYCEAVAEAMKLPKNRVVVTYCFRIDS